MGLYCLLEHVCPQYAWGGSEGGRLINFQCRGVLLIWIIVGQWRPKLAVGAGWGCYIVFSRLPYLFFFLPLSGNRPDID